MGVLEIIGALLALAVPLLQLWISKAPQRKQEATEDAVKKIRETIAGDDAGAMSVLLDSVSQTADYTPVLGNYEDTKRRLESVCGK